MSRTIRELLDEDISSWRTGRKQADGSKENALLSYYCNVLPRYLLLPLQPDYGLELHYWRLVESGDTQQIERLVKQYTPRDLYGDPSKPQRYPDLSETAIGHGVWEPMGWYSLASWGLQALYPAFEQLTGAPHICQHRVNALYLDFTFNGKARIAA